MMRRLLAPLLLLVALVAMHGNALAGVMTKETLAREFPSPLMVGDKDP